MAMEMGGEIDKQNTQIDRITDKVKKQNKKYPFMRFYERYKNIQVYFYPHYVEQKC